MKALWSTVVLVLCLVTVAGLLQPIPGSSAQAAPARDEVADILRQQPLGPLLGKQVMVVPTVHHPRQGKLETYDPHWIRIRAQDGKVYCYPAASLLFVSEEEVAKP